jgi:hypothetical protein
MCSSLNIGSDLMFDGSIVCHEESASEIKSF